MACGKIVTAAAFVPIHKLYACISMLPKNRFAVFHTPRKDMINQILYRNTLINRMQLPFEKE